MNEQSRHGYRSRGSGRTCDLAVDGHMTDNTTVTLTDPRLHHRGRTEPAARVFRPRVRISVALVDLCQRIDAPVEVAVDTLADDHPRSVAGRTTITELARRPFSCRRAMV